MQLDLFHGRHLPLIRARAALEAGDIRGAQGELSGVSDEEAVQLAIRLALLEERLVDHGNGEPRAPAPSVDGVHAAFVVASARGAEASRPGAGPIPPVEWFRLYAWHVAASLAAAGSDRRFRGWCRIDWELAAGRAGAALATVGRLGGAGAAPGTWLAAARAASVAGDAARARSWVLISCLLSQGSLDPGPQPLATSGCLALDAPAPALPRLPAAIEALWVDAEDLGLPDPRSAWVPAIGILDGVFTIAELHAPEVVAASGFDVAGAAPAAGEPAAHGFLRALVTARAARARERPHGAGCGAGELAARGRMRRAARPLLERYLDRLGLGFP